MTPDRNLAPEQRKLLFEALLAAYGDFDEIRRLVLYKLGDRLTNVKAASSLESGADQVIQWAETNGRVSQLIDAVLEDKPNNGGVRQLAASLGGTAGGKGGRAAPEPAGILRRWRPLMLFSLPLIIVLGGTICLISWKIPARVSVELTASSVQISSPAEASRVLLKPAKAVSLSLRGFEKAILLPEAVEVFQPGASERWTPFGKSGNLVLVPAGLAGQETITVEPPPGDPDLSLDRVFAAGAEIRLASPEDRLLAVDIAGSPAPGTIHLPARFLLHVRHAGPGHGQWPVANQSLRLRLRMPDEDRNLTFHPAARTGVEIEFPANSEPEVNSNGLAVDRVDFVATGAAGEPESTLTGVGKIRFLDPPGMDDVPLAKGDWLTLVELEEFRLRDLAFAKNGLGLVLRFEGTVGRIASGQPKAPLDRNPDYFTTLWQSKRLAALAAAIAAVVSAAAGIWEFLRAPADV